MKVNTTMTISCPCGSEKAYAECCQRFHDGVLFGPLPASPVQLMRSRYSAFALRLTDYLLATWHATTRPHALSLADNPDWVALQIVSDSADGDQGKVHFRAFYQLGSETGMLEEHSEFVRESGRWFYLNGKTN